MKKFKFLLFVLFFSLNVLTVSASSNTYERDSSNNYGVNKHWTINSSNMSNVKNTPLVDASEKIYDFADILTDSEELLLYNLMIEYINATNMDMVFVSVNMAYTYDSKNETFAADFYDYNDFGIDFENYSGILLLRNNYEKNKYFNIYTFGNAQLYYDYDRLESILNSINSDFVDGEYLSGIKNFINMSTSFYKKGIPLSMRSMYVDVDGYLRKRYTVPIFICIGGSAFVTFIVMLFLIRKNRMVKKATKAMEYLVKNSINYSVSQDNFINSHTTSYTHSSSSGGGGSHSGSSGGGHSCGGGRHG